MIFAGSNYFLIDLPLNEKLTNFSLELLLSNTMYKRNIDTGTKILPHFLNVLVSFSCETFISPCFALSLEKFFKYLGAEKEKKNP